MILGIWSGQVAVTYGRTLTPPIFILGQLLWGLQKSDRYDDYV